MAKKESKETKEVTEVKESNQEAQEFGGHDQDFWSGLVKQVNVEYQLAWQNQSSKLKKNLSRLKLYNNQKKEDDVVGDPLLFTVFQTVLASLYDDQLMAVFEGREDGDDETAENLMRLSEYDYELMEKAKLDYYWMWDTLFFGRGLVKLMEFSKDERYKCPIPELVDPMTFLRDPDAVSVRGTINGDGAMRFGGREVKINKWRINSDSGFFNYEDLSLGTEIKSLLQDAKDERDMAQGRETLQNKSDEELGDNANVPLLEWYTHYNGKKVLVYLANSMSKPIKYTEFGDSAKSSFPLIDRPMYPTAHDWDGTSVPDLTEDKQRQKSVMLNLGIQSVKGDLYPMYLYDEARIKNKSDLATFGFNKFIGIQGDGDVRGAVQPMNKVAVRMDLVSFILETLDASAQRATATPEMQQGSLSDEKRTLGELNLIASKVDTRYSLTAKVFGWSEKDFWSQWYGLYKKYFVKSIDEKVIRVAGSYGNTWRPLTRENIIMAQDPDITIESRNVSENGKVKDRILMNQYAQIVMQDPEANKRFFFKKLAKLNGFEEDEIDRLYPPTADEMIAEKENEMLSNDELAQVSVNDDDITHMEVHGKASETKAKEAHIKAHLDSLMVKRSQPELFQQGQVNQAEALTAQNAPTATPTGQNVQNMSQASAMQPSEAVTPNAVI